MTVRKARAVWILLIAGLVGIALALTLSLERAEQLVPSPPGPEARANAFLAAARLLDRMGLPARSQRELAPLPSADHVLLIGSESRILGVRRTDELLAWLAAGGCLIVGPYLVDGHVTAETHADPLLRALGVEVFETTADGEPRTVYTLDLDGSGETVDARFHTGHGLAFVEDEEEDPTGESGEDGGEDEAAHLFNIVYDDYGAGRYYVVNDTAFLRNDQVGELDHARLLWQLATLDGPRAGAVVVFGQRYASLWSLLVRQAWPALLALAACAAALAWRGASRFGPHYAIAAAGSRSVMDHVEAAGHFLWRQKGADVLLDGMRRSLLRQAGLRRPQLARMDEAAQAATLAGGTGLDPAAVEAALFGICPHRRDVYTRWMRTLSALRRSL